MPCGHALILDKRIIACIPLLEDETLNDYYKGSQDKSAFRLKLAFGIFDKFLGTRVQMVNFTGAPIDMHNVFFQYKDVKLLRDN